MSYKKFKQLFNNLYESSKNYLSDKKQNQYDNLPYLDENPEDTLEEIVKQENFEEPITLCKGHFYFDEIHLNNYELIVDSTILLKRKKKYIH